MKTLILTGSKSEIAAAVARIDGVIRDVIVFVEEPADAISTPNQTMPPSLDAMPPSSDAPPSSDPTQPVEDMWAEMDPYMVRVGGADYSREAIYTRMEGE